MYVNERDQINYHGFLRALREMHKVSQETVCKGICTVSGMNRFEKGNRLAEKLMRDRLTARLGISGEKYEDYLQPKEYVRWEQRLRIVKAIEERKLSKAKAELCEYEALEGLNRINVQFVEAMRFIIMSLEGADEEELLTCIKKAVKCTVSNPDKALSGFHLLADQEINLIAEQMRLSSPKKVVRDVNAWRISEYEKLIAYIENSCWEKLQKAKVYPKIVYYICQLLLDGSPDEAACRRGLELCHNAIELLRDTSRLYYFIELTESRRSLAEHLMKFDIPASEKSELDEMLKDNNAWENVFKELYEEYKVAPYMSDFCYLYYETECHNMVEVIETRRNMLNLSRVKLGEGICSAKTIIRFEREGMNPSVDLVRALFEKMGLCAEYRRARVITNDVEALMLSIEVVERMNNREIELSEYNLNVLEDKLHMGIVYNRQQIKRWRNWLLLQKREIDKKELYHRSAEVLECSVPRSCVFKMGNKFFTREEWTCLFDLAFETSGELAEESERLIEEVCLEKDDYKFNSANIFKLTFLAGGLESYLGNVGRHEEAIKLGNEMIELFLKNRRMNALSNNLYSNLWCAQQLEADLIDGENAKKILESCIILSKLIRRMNWSNFYAQKLCELETVN
ncbi:MAG: hypothetical protein IJE49_04915 [Agathobacter sp.]|nr:hypothetical protein [Agathobacter sp.]